MPPVSSAEAAAGPLGPAIGLEVHVRLVAPGGRIQRRPPPGHLGEGAIGP